MSRSNGPGVPPNGWPADYPPADGQNSYRDPYYAPQQPQQQRPPQPMPSVAAGRQPRLQPQTAPSRTPQVGLPSGIVQPQGYAPPAPAYGQQQYAPQPAPQYAQTQPTPQQYAPPQQAQPHQPHADPRYAGYQGYDPAGVPTATRPTAPQGYAPPQQYTAPPAYVPETTVRTQPPQQRPAPPAIDPHGYDLGNYMPAATPSAADPRTQRPTGSPSWSPYADAAPAPRTQPPAAREPDYAPYALPVQAQSYSGQYAPDANQGAIEPVAAEGEYDDEEEYEAPRRTRYGLIAASLFGAIAVGGGLAYAYKAFVAPPSTQVASTPVVKGTAAPAKVKPAEPGGTKFADPGPKMQESLMNSQTASADGGPKAVTTYTVGRDGSMAQNPAASGEAAPAQPAGAAPKVPGMIIAGLNPTPAPAAPPAQPVSVQPPAKPAPKAAVLAPPPSDAADAADVAAPAPKKVVVPKAPKPAAVAALGGPVTAPAPATTGSAGFVAVLASVPASGSSKMQAMQQFADLQQKYPGVLGNKSPDVVEATVKNLPYNRLVVGPPGSRDAAKSLCDQLKVAGYTADCWVTGF